MFAKLKELREEREGGFTLIELLVVILIIGILAAIAIPMFLNQRKSAVDSSVQSDVKNAATQIETWMVKNPNGSLTPADVTGPAAGTGVLTDVKVGTGTTVKVIVSKDDARVYTICGSNTGGDQSGNGKFIVYKSNDGGLKSGVACPETMP